MGVFAEFRSLGAFLLDFLEDELLKEVIFVSSLSLIFWRHALLEDLQILTFS